MASFPCMKRQTVLKMYFDTCTFCERFPSYDMLFSILSIVSVLFNNVLGIYKKYRT